MPKIVDSENRKELILANALEVFAEVGYFNCSLSLIAEKSLLSRPTLYRYFSDKDEIFHYAIKYATEKLFIQLSSIALDKNTPNVIDRLKKMCHVILSQAEENEESLRALMDVFLHYKTQGVNFSDSIASRIAKLNILFKRLISKGILEKNVKADINAEEATNHLITLIKSFCFQYAFFGTENDLSSNAIIDRYLDGIALN